MELNADDHPTRSSRHDLRCHRAPCCSGDDRFTIRGLAEVQPQQDIEVEVTGGAGSTTGFTAKCRIDTANELEYYFNGGILQYVLRKLAA